MRGGGINIPGAVQRHAFKVGQLLEGRAGVGRRRKQRGTARVSIRIEAEQAERKLFFIFNDKKSPVRQLLNRGRLKDAIQRAEGWQVMGFHVFFRRI